MKRPVDVIKDLDEGKTITGHEAELILAPLLSVLKSASVFASYLYRADKTLLADRPPEELAMYDEIIKAITSFSDKPWQNSGVQLDA